MPESVDALRAVVIGGSGFIGSHVADQLSEGGHSVCLYDRVDSPWRRPDQAMVVGELADDGSLADAISGADVVYNFAALADLDEAMDRPIEATEVNILGNVKVLECCRKEGVGRFVFASTVYVNSREGGFYRCSKQAAEEFVREYQRAYGLDFTILRYGSLYGPRAADTNFLRRVLSRALLDGAVRYEGSPEAIREYIHVEDAARASVTILAEDFRNRTVVITGLESIRMSDLLEMCAEILGLSTGVEYLGGDQSGHYVRTPYADRSLQARKYIPSLTIDLGQGLLQLIDEIRDNDTETN
jgi:UDP-glucose 4-epimerase